MISFKKYKKPEMEVVLIENDIITTSGGELGDGDITDPWNNMKSFSSYSRPLGIYKRD